MSKIFDENWKERVRLSWKRFAASVTDLLNKYRYDPFFHTETNVIILQVAFALILLGVVGASFSVLYRDISAAIVDGIKQGLATGSPQALAPSIVAQIELIRTQNLATIVTIIVGTTVVFGYVIARVTLQPARNALAAQKQFIGNIAHELRTPLSVIKTNTEVALFENNMSAELKQIMRSNVEELDRISEIINNLLSLSALVKPERMEFTTVDLSELASRVVSRFTQLARHNNLQITVRKSPQACVWGNETALEQILGNLLKNAIQYTPRNGQIMVTTAPGLGDQVEVTIQDSGVGIARKDLFRIFEPFYRAEQSRNRTQGGSSSGLGLTIVSELLKLHNGKITIRSAVGRGTSVVILFPAARKGAQVGGSELHEGLNEVAVDFSSGRTA
ncbi:MAG: HAMP domain-containing sensor histidine kinase [Candidatus Pacebacteria bacterium]|nr:HAMP domain-containing sensor histidine kinase [Candidatus Paceibacterota bacterium]